MSPVGGASRIAPRLRVLAAQRTAGHDHAEAVDHDGGGDDESPGHDGLLLLRMTRCSPAARRMASVTGRSALSTWPMYCRDTPTCRAKAAVPPAQADACRMAANTSSWSRPVMAPSPPMAGRARPSAAAGDPA